MNSDENRKKDNPSKEELKKIKNDRVKECREKMKRKEKECLQKLESLKVENRLYEGKVEQQKNTIKMFTELCKQRGIDHGMNLSSSDEE